MADLGQDGKSLVLKALEMQVTIDELRLAQQRMKIEMLRAEKRIGECQYNIDGMETSIQEKLLDLEATKVAARNAGGEI